MPIYKTLHLKSDQQLNSPYYITSGSSIKEMSLKVMITN